MRKKLKTNEFKVPDVIITKPDEKTNSQHFKADTKRNPPSGKKSFLPVSTL